MFESDLNQVWYEYFPVPKSISCRLRNLWDKMPKLFLQVSKMKNTILALGGPSLWLWWMQTGKEQADTIVTLIEIFKIRTTPILETTYNKRDLSHSKIFNITKKIDGIIENLEVQNTQNFDIDRMYMLSSMTDSLAHQFMKIVNNLKHEFSEKGRVVDGPFMFQIASDFNFLDKIVHSNIALVTTTRNFLEQAQRLL